MLDPWGLRPVHQTFIARAYYVGRHCALNSLSVPRGLVSSLIEGVGPCVLLGLSLSPLPLCLSFTCFVAVYIFFCVYIFVFLCLCGICVYLCIVCVFTNVWVCVCVNVFTSICVGRDNEGSLDALA